MTALRQDILYTLRTLRRSPGFTSTALVALALGIGTNTAIFSIANSVLLQPLQYRNSEELVTLDPHPITRSAEWAVSAWRTRAASLVELGGYGGLQVGTLIADGGPEQVNWDQVTWNFFSFLGAPIALGRGFTDADAEPAAPAVAILAHAFWAGRFGADPQIVGRAVVLNGESLTIVGVTAPSFRFPTPAAPSTSALLNDMEPDFVRIANPSTSLNIIGRLSPGSTPSSAATELLQIFKEEAAPYFTDSFIDQLGIGVTPLKHRLVGNLRQHLLLIMAGAGVVLMAACANLGNVLLMRAAARRRELGLRIALGASRARLAQLVFTESIVLALIGSLVALLLAMGMSRFFWRVLAADRPAVLEPPAIDLWVLSFNTGIACAVGALCGLVSLTAIRRSHPGNLIRHDGTSAVTYRTQLSRVLLSTQIAVTFVVVVGASLLVQTVWNLNTKDRGFVADRLLTLQVSPPVGGDIPDPGEFVRDATERISRLPGVVSVAAVSSVPLAGPSVSLTDLVLEGQAPTATEDGLDVAVVSVTPTYFATLMTRLVGGRDFHEMDRLGSETVVIVNQAFRQRYAAGRDIVGSHLRSGDNVFTIVGIVEDVPDRSLREAAQPLLFTPFAQMSALPIRWPRMTYVVRVREGDPRAVAPAVRSEIWEINPRVIIDQVGTMEQRVSASVRSERDSALLIGLFALATLVIASIGVYGITAYFVVQRTKEIGVRMALGAAAWNVRILVLAQTLVLTIAGIAAGVVVATAATRLLSSMLYGVPQLDPISFTGAALLMITVALMASFVPARTATRVDVNAVLKGD